jgi:hypothetical protein
MSIGDELNRVLDAAKEIPNSWQNPWMATA